MGFNSAFKGLKRYSGFHGSGSYIDISYGIRWNFSYVF